MASGRIDLTRTSGSTYLTFWAEWVTSSNGTVANTSTATLCVYVYKSPSSTQATYGTTNTSVSVQSIAQAENGLSVRVNPGSSVLLFAKTFTIKHDNDGTVSAPVSITVGGNIMGASGSGNITPDRIPRQATLSSVPEKFTDADSPTIKFSNPAGNAVDKLEVCISSDGYAIEAPYRTVEKTSTSYTFVLTESEKNALYNTTLNGSTTREVHFYVRTTIGGLGYVDHRKSIFEVVDCAPTMNPIITDVGAVSTKLTGDPGKIIKGYNYIEVAANFTTYKGASIVKQSITCDSRVVESGNAVFENVNSNTFIFSVTDNRGQTVTQTIPQDSIDYIRLSCYMNVSAPDADGDLEFYIGGNYYDGSFGAVDNELKLEWRYKVNDGEYNDWTPIVPELSNGTYRATITMSGLDYQSFYTFQARAADKPYYDYIETIEYKVKTTPVFDWGENDFNFNVPVTIQGKQVYPVGYTTRISRAYTQETDIAYEANSYIKLMRDNSPTELYNPDVAEFDESGLIHIKKDMLALVNVHILANNPGGRSWIRLMNYDVKWKYTECIAYGSFTTSQISIVLPLTAGTKLGVLTVEKMTINNSGLVGSYIEIIEL